MVRPKTIENERFVWQWFNLVIPAKRSKYLRHSETSLFIKDWATNIPKSVGEYTIKIWRQAGLRQTPRKPLQDPPDRLSGDMRMHTLEQIIGKGKQKYPCRKCAVCLAHMIRSETRYICKFCVVPLHKGECFERYHTMERY